MIYIGRVTVMCPGMGGGYEGEETWEEEYDNYQEASAFVDYYRHYKNSALDPGENGLVFVDGEVIIRGD